MYKEEIIIKVIGKTLIEYPEIEQNKLRAILEEVLYDYDIQPSTKALVPISDLNNRIGLYLAAKTLDGLSKNTIKGYFQHLMRFARNLQKNVADIDSMDIRRHLAAFLKTGVKDSTMNTEISILRSFFKWLEDEDYIVKSPMRKIKNTKTGKRLLKALTIEELEMLREGCKTLRERALIETFYATGGRLSEVIGFNKSDINWQNMSARVIGKGDKERIVYFSHKAFYHLRKYLFSRTDDCEALFITERKPYKRVGNRAVQREVKKIAARTNITKNVHPHVLRHTFATLTLENGASLAEVQALLGHSSPATTQIYAVVSEQMKQEAYRKHHAQ